MKKLFVISFSALMCCACCNSNNSGDDAVKADIIDTQSAVEKADTTSGVICDATMNTLTIVTKMGDTLSFSTLDAERITQNGILIGDTAKVTYTKVQDSDVSSSMFTASKVLVTSAAR